jgi:hypothetical protein
METTKETTLLWHFKFLSVLERDSAATNQKALLFVGTPYKKEITINSLFTSIITKCFRENKSKTIEFLVPKKKLKNSWPIPLIFTQLTFPVTLGGMPITVFVKTIFS